jgi:hypothetical protein
MEKVVKNFKVVAKSSNTNSFGLHQFVVMATDGEAYKIHGSMYVKKDRGDIVPRIDGAFIGFEMPEKLDNAPEEVVKAVFNLN